MKEPVAPMPGNTRVIPESTWNSWSCGPIDAAGEQRAQSGSAGLSGPGELLVLLI